MKIKVFFIFLSCFAVFGCSDESWNNPYPFEDPKANTLYTSFSERPNHLDPARAYTTAELPIIAQIYEPPLQYHYLKRPYVLEPLTAESLPEIHFLNENQEVLEENADDKKVAYTEYIIHIKPGILFQPHPAFAKNKDGNPLYLNLSLKEAQKYAVLSDFKELGTKELTAEDYVYQIKRLAEPSLSSPIFGMMSGYIIGLAELREALSKESNIIPRVGTEHDLSAIPFEGAKVLSRYSYRILIKGKYPEFRYWLTMCFFAAVPREVALFYAQPGLSEHNISLDWYPVGTGPYQMIENNPDRRMSLDKNPNFRGETFPNEGEKEDVEKGLLADAGKSIPFLDKVIFSLEREDIPFWNKFLQGYYDMSGVSSDNFNSAIRFSDHGNPEVSERLKNQGIRLQTSVSSAIWYWAFNMLDETVGGYSEKSKKLRMAIAKAFDVDEFVSIFMNGRGVLANGPLPPDIFGYDTQGQPVPYNIEEAKALLKEAGFPEGLRLYYDTVSTGDPSEIAIQTWIKKQFNKIGIEVVFRDTDFNRFQEKIRNGNGQIYFNGWNADYPDPENFLFLLYTPNGSAKFGGENLSNYSNKDYDALFEKMRGLSDGPERKAIIAEMIAILQKDAPWVWGFYPKSFALQHSWLRTTKPSGMINNTLKYARINPTLRAELRQLWNKPMIWPFFVVVLLLFILMLPGIIHHWQQERNLKERL